MSDQYVGEIRMVAFPYAPAGWALCNGQRVTVQQNQMLFALLGVRFGGDGSTYFNLPDLQGRVPLHAGTGAGLPSYALGQKGGSATYTLTQNELPSHTHTATFTPTGTTTPPTVNVTVNGSSSSGNSTTPNGNYLAGSAQGSVTHQAGVFVSNPGSTTLGPLAGITATITGGATGDGVVANALAGNGQPFSIEPPYLAVYFIIATEGLWPQQQ